MSTKPVDEILPEERFETAYERDRSGDHPVTNTDVPATGPDGRTVGAALRERDSSTKTPAPA